MKWEQDLIRDIRYHDDFLDNLDWNGGVFKDIPYWETHVWHPVTGAVQSVSESNIKNLKNQFLKIKDKCRCILEIGVSNGNDPNFCTTSTFVQNKNKDTIYVGVDSSDKSFVDDHENNVYTLRKNSSEIIEVMNFIRSKGFDEIDFIFIDGWHSINQVLIDWEYTEFLSNYGIVGFHDTSHHPGPYLFVKNLNKEKWNVIENCAIDENPGVENVQDFGIGFVWKKL